MRSRRCMTGPPAHQKRSGTLVHQSIRIKVTLRSTRYSAIFPFFTTTFCPLTHAPSTFLSVLTARAMPFSMASSKLLFELEIISVTLATDVEASSFAPTHDA
jgi:hypothetical protein